MRYLCVVAVALCVVGLCVGSALSNGQNADEGGIQISVAPNTIVLGSPVDSLTVHSNLPLDTVVGGSVAVNGVTDISVWADDCDDLVARVDLSALDDVAPPSLTVVLTGTLTDGTPFTASDTVRVVVCRKK